MRKWRGGIKNRKETLKESQIEESKKEELQSNRAAKENYDANHHHQDEPSYPFVAVAGRKKLLLRVTRIEVNPIQGGLWLRGCVCVCV